MSDVRSSIRRALFSGDRKPAAMLFAISWGSLVTACLLGKFGAVEMGPFGDQWLWISLPLMVSFGFGPTFSRLSRDPAAYRAAISVGRLPILAAAVGMIGTALLVWPMSPAGPSRPALVAVCLGVVFFFPTTDKDGSE